MEAEGWPLITGPLATGAWGSGRLRRTFTISACAPNVWKRKKALGGARKMLTLVIDSASSTRALHLLGRDVRIPHGLTEGRTDEASAEHLPWKFEKVLRLK